MGAWGSGSFENDTALDWAAGVESLDDVREPFERLKALKASGEKGQPAYIDADLASELVAAAETVAMLMGRVIPGFPEDLRKRLADAGEPDDALYHAARESLFSIMRSSELAELWAEGTEEGGANEWQVAMTGLVDRLNPDLEFTPWEEADIETKSGGPAGPCAFCDQPVDRASLWGMNITDYSNQRSFDRGFWFHLPCLNARLHHKFAILDLKFDPNRMPDLDSP